ncbi:DUF7553 family protein [Halomicrococcus sp. NG-SE-24]|uniref:DUF7553 family protein n=1 Tax=Halomicrococcus sp. NG-SE-24 TaxID=3436928 RepID=UPI003D95D0AC
MPRDQLTQAAEEVKHAAAETDGEAAERMDDLAETLENLASTDQGPDHGRLARITHSLSELREGADGAAAERVDAAQDHVKAYRETVEGV